MAGCTHGSPLEDGSFGTSEQAIINGEPDVTHDAVVAVLGNNSACTGTIIAKDVASKKGFVLTAAHCVPSGPEIIVRGTNYQNGTQYAVTSYLAHPNYASNQAYDFAMVTFTWANNEPPVIPRATPAQDQALGPGSNMTFVGYGVTENNDFNSTRYYFNGKLADDDALSLYYNQSSMGSFANNGGPCFGDSGGPALLNVAGVGEVVVGVTSYGDQNCTQFGVSARVSAVDSWIADYIANGGGGSVQLTCDECSTEATSSGGTCEGPVDDCFTDSECSAFYDCLVACDGQPQSCVDQCVNDYPNGLETYLAIFTCLCNVGCTSECANEPMCEGPQGCGFTAEDPQCLSCLEGNCCSQGSACAADQDCKNCLTGANPDPNCINENVLAAQFYQCLAQKCGDECGIQGGGGGGQGGSGAGSGSGAGGGGVGAGGVGAGGGGVGPGGGGVGAGDVGGNGAGAGDEGGDDGSGGNNNDDDGNVSAVACTCRAAGGDAPNGNVAIALGAALAGLFASRRKRRVS